MTTHRPFRFGVQVHRAESAAAWTEKAKKVEALGCSTLILPDHVAAPILAFGSALTAAAAVTSTLRLGTLVLANDFRHPALVAREAATVDLLSDGRFELGIGASWMRDDYEAIHLPFAPAGVRVGRLAESIQIVKALFGDGPVTFHGRHYTLTNLDGYPKPKQRPHPPLVLVGGGRRLLSLAAREADTIGLVPQASADGGLPLTDATAAATTQKVSWIREAAGERMADLELNILLQGLVVTDDALGAGEELGRESAPLTPKEVRDSPHLLIGTLGAIGDTLRARRQRWGISYVVVREGQMDAFAPVVARLAGT